MENSPKNEKKIILTDAEKNEILEAMEIVTSKEGETLAGGWVQASGGFSKKANNVAEEL